MQSKPSLPPRLSRRQFVQTTGTALTASALSTWADDPPPAGVSPGEIIRIGLIGCGGRGTGAAAQALKADLNVRLVAMADAFPDRLATSLNTLQSQESLGPKIEVPNEKRFVGFDAYQELIKSGVDVVLLATPPHFRPWHLKAAIDAGKHVFAEKPVAVDAAGVRSVLASCEKAKEKKLSIVSGLCLRFSNAFKETIQRLHDGELGKIRTLQANDFRGPIWVKPRQKEWSEMEYQMHNWYYFTWLSGDFNVEQHVHFLDVCSWIMQEEYPVTALGMGGRQARTGAEYGNIYDHHSVLYEYANGVKLFSNCRQQSNCRNDMSVHVVGAHGTAELSDRRSVIRAAEAWTFEGKKNDIYQTEHDALFASIRSGQPLNHGSYMAKSTLMAIMGRMATYTGQLVSWEQAFNSKEDLTPSSYDWDGEPPPATIAVPGVTALG